MYQSITSTVLPHHHTLIRFQPSSDQTVSQKTMTTPTLDRVALIESVGKRTETINHASKQTIACSVEELNWLAVSETVASFSTENQCFIDRGHRCSKGYYLVQRKYCSTAGKHCHLTTKSHHIWTWHSKERRGMSHTE